VISPIFATFKRDFRENYNLGWLVFRMPRSSPGQIDEKSGRMKQRPGGMPISFGTNRETGQSGRKREGGPVSVVVEFIGGVAAVITTLCWVPQAIKVIRTRDTRSLSLIMYLMLAVGIALWLVYGLLILSWPLIGANLVTLVLVVTILAMKLRFG
jgi:MtN3 and saliva related transmembrane protein